MKSCSRCLLYSRFPGIKFKRDNVCSECLTFDKMWSKQINNPEFVSKTATKLKRILMEVKKSDNEFDYAVPVSGGTDSLQVLNLLKSEYGLNPLAITINNAFLNPEAKKNLDKVVEQLKVKHIYYDLRIPLLILKNFLLETGTFCAVCVYSILFHVARIAFENNIRLLVFGMLKREDAFLPYGTSPFNFLSVANRYKREFYEPELIKQKSPFLLPYYLFIGKVITLPDNINWETDKIRRGLEEKFAIKLGEEHYDFIMHDFAKWIAYKKYGFSQTTLKYCQLIRNNKITREKALEVVEKEEGREPKELKYFMNYFDITERHIDDAIKKGKRLDVKLLNRFNQLMRRTYFRTRI